MFENLDVLRMAGGLASNAAARQTAISRNVANANTPGYKALDVPGFAATYRQSDGFAPRATLPGHFTGGVADADTVPKPRLKPGTEAPDGNTVTLETELVAGAEAKQQHDMAIAIYRSSTNLLRLSLGVAK
ncbi:MAG: FlgB family protein [Rhodobacteraceae bacterium]|nr:FlgB family protein [Paracoccaceae bacterium]